ncbi:Vms1/Ankzf1 family peptidyl-tRNA hydrolase [Geodermatophilus sp. SYSU D01186]
MDVSFLEPVFSATGPYATVCADVTHTTENADTEVELRVRALAERLTEQGAPEVVVEAVRGRLLEANDGGDVATLRGRAVVVAADGSVVLDQPLVEAPRQEVAQWSPHADVLPVLRELPGRIPHIVVLVDRTGGDISYVGMPGEGGEEETVSGETFHIRKVKVGGWAHDHWQNSAEGQWEDNAGRVADRISSYARRLSPRFVLVAGDVRARTRRPARGGVALIDLGLPWGGAARAPAADRESVDRRAAELVAEHEGHDEADAVEKVQAAGAHGLAVTGTAAVVEALRKGQVETLVLADQPDDGATLLVGNSPLELGVDQHDMDALGIHGTVVPAPSALLAASVASSAGVVVVPRAAMPDGVPVAAVLRYTDASTPSAQ